MGKTKGQNFIVHSAIGGKKKKNTMSFIATWMELENLVL